MGTRLQFHDILLQQGTPNVYFQPPESVILKYPCIIYNKSAGATAFANNKPYHYTQQYDVMLVAKDPDEAVIFQNLTQLPMSIFDRHYFVDNLNHDVFSVYY